jgi:hypothetical protein
MRSMPRILDNFLTALEREEMPFTVPGQSADQFAASRSGNGFKAALYDMSISNEKFFSFIERINRLNCVSD